MQKAATLMWTMLPLRNCRNKGTCCGVKLVQQLQGSVQLRADNRKHSLAQMYQLLLHDEIETRDFSGNSVLHLVREFRKL